MLAKLFNELVELELEISVLEGLGVIGNGTSNPTNSNPRYIL